MSNSAFANLNKIPIRTKSWLRVNDITMKNFEMPSIGEFSNVKVVGDNYEGVIIEKLIEGTVVPFNKNFIYGVGEELINQCEKEFNHGYLVKIGRGTTVDEPIIIEYEFNEENPNLVDNFIIEAEENSKSNIIIKYVSRDNTRGYHNGVCKIYCKENSEVNVTKINMLNEDTVNLDSNMADIKYGGKANFISIDIGGAYSITNFHGDLVEENSSSNLESVYFGNKNKIIDTNYVMTHKGRRSNSKIVSKGVLLDESSKIFKGTLDFKKGASRSVGDEEEFCMILSPKATSKAVPLLLCEEDDVSGKHAASAGKIDENKLFYLMSRGISEKESKKLIIEASFSPIISKISIDDIREEILEQIQRRLLNE